MEQDFFASLRALRESPPPGDPPPGTEIVIDRVCYIDASWGKVFAVAEAGGRRYRLGEEELANLLERQLVGRRIVAFRKTRHSCRITELAAMASEDQQEKEGER